MCLCGKFTIFWQTCHKGTSYFFIILWSDLVTNAPKCIIMKKILFISAVLALGLCSCGNKLSVQSNNWELKYSNGINIYHEGQEIMHGIHAEYCIDNHVVKSQEYSTPQSKLQNIDDQFGKGKEWVLTYSSDNHPTLKQTFRIYNDFLLTNIEISSTEKIVKTNYMVPVSAHTDSLLSSKNRRKLFVPFDNDAWIRYYSTHCIDSTLRSYEVTSVYDANRGDGIVMGSIEHDKWKNAIELSDKSHSLKMYSGVADKLTRDVHAHGYLSGKSVKSATFMIGHFKDWRDGMERYADNNAKVAPRRAWDKAMPVGWNSWGALAFDVNHTNSTEVVKFFANELQPHSFANQDGLLYTGLDSGWNNFSDADLKDFADQCKLHHQVPCIYWTPFTDWGKDPERTVPGTSYQYKDVYLYANGKPQELDGAYAIDPTHPAVKKMMEDTHALFQKYGYKYVKMDFMTHGRMEADHWYNKHITTGTEAYNYGMQLLDSIFSDMYLNLSISPIFPAQYAQSRRIACDAWNKIKDTEYTMNALSWGWWIDRVYQYNDADHVVLRDATDGENRARITSSIITGLFITGDDFSANGKEEVKNRARKYLTNPDVNAIATGRSFRPLDGNNDRSEDMFIRKDKDGTTYLAVFNYTDQERRFSLPLDKMDISSTSSIEELWSHKNIDRSSTIVLPAKDAMIFKFK